MFSPQFMNFIIDPKNPSKNNYKEIPAIYNDNKIKSDITEIKGCTSKLANLNKDIFEKYQKFMT
ncbi:MAG: hypothetical protein PHC34_05680 [Candidatus Gastranaerophilales bacterium]|nr:hypothetical protein [Candidatus Gastranaerophilales bacterium]